MAYGGTGDRPASSGPGLAVDRAGATRDRDQRSPAAIEQAETLSTWTGGEVDFHVAYVYDAVEVPGETSYGLVFTGIGALSWLPSIDRWAEIVPGLLRPSGRLFIREGQRCRSRGRDRVLSVDLPDFEMVEPQV